ncbi:MAG TPA: hypothetical protein VFK05_39190 [Polyangiaceae bacterium]|nr:hypothetical protein [Polyangiaceae bacterium]
MSCVRRVSYLTGCVVLSAIACSAAPASSPDRLRRFSDDSLICRAATDRFVGLPGLEAGTVNAPGSTSHGSWWIRGCSAERVANGLRLRFEGPGWYFVDRREGDFALHQQVTFTLGIELEGSPALTVDKGVAALRFEPRTAPEVRVRVSRPEVHATSAWGSLVRLLPGVSVRARAARRLSALAESALREKLREGATATYELGSGQYDVALGQLPPGKTPRNAFPDGIRWLVNERVFLPPNATQVVGPIDPGLVRLDARIEQGHGLGYRAVCQGEMPAAFDAIASGHLDRLEHVSGQLARASPAQGTLTGQGEQSALLRVADCKFFVALAAADDSTTIGAVRVRR